MSTFCVDIISQETIKPSSPTPPHLKFLKLSLLDQLEPPGVAPMILFFSASTSVTPHEATDRLKKSLPDTLALFYPLAGRTSGNEFFDCNDQGVNLFETRVNTRVTQVLTHPIAEELVQLLPKDNFSGSGPKVLSSFQINIFDCGGMALGMILSHKIADAFSMSLVLNTWADITRGGAESKIVSPTIGAAASFFPPKQTDVRPIITPSFDGTQAKLVSKRVVFNASSIAALGAKCSNMSYTPTRVEAVTAFIWSCAMKAAKSSSSALMCGLNLRSRIDPPLQNSSFGNIMLALLATSTGDYSTNLGCLVGRLHDTIAEIDRDYVRKLQANNGVSVLYDSFEQVLQDGVSYFIITSLCRFPYYEANFGWGKPEWATGANLSFPDVTLLMDTKCGTGIQAWITLTEDMMSRFECNPHLIASNSKI